MAGGFNLTSNLIVKTDQISLNSAINNIKTAVSKATGTLGIGVDLTLVDALHKKLAAIQQLAKSGVGNIGIKIRGATTKQIENIEGLGKALKKHGPEIKAFKSKDISIKVAVPTKASIEKIKDLAIWLKMATPIIKGFTNRNLVVGLRAPTTKAIANINAANIALKQIQPILAAMGGGANIGIKITGLGGKRLDSFAKGLGGVSAQLTKTIPDLHKLNTVLSQKITHLGQFQQAATAAGNSLTAMGKASSSVRGAVNRTSSSVSNLAKGTQEATSYMYEFGKSGGLALKRFGAFTVATSVVFGLVYAIKDAVVEAIDFEKQLAKIAQVTGEKMIRGVKGVADEVTRLSLAYGGSSKELLEVSQVFAQAGLKGYELQKALDAVAKSDLSPTFTNMENTGEGVISMMGQFKIKADEYEQVLGSINAVSAAYAVESDDLITAIRVFGGVFAQSSNKAKGGVKQVQELMAVFTSIRDTTRESAESISTGLRTIFSRIQRPRTIEFLKDYGIELTDLKGNFIGAYEAVQRLGDGLSRMDKMSIGYKRIGEELGGYRQIGKVLPLLSEYAKREEALGIAINGTRSLEEQAGIQLATLSRQITMVAEDFKRLIREIINTDTFRALTTTIFEMAKAFIAVGDAIKPIIPMIGILATIKGFIYGKQFLSGAIDQIKHNKESVVGAGIRKASVTGVSGGGLVGGIGSTFVGWARKLSSGNLKSQLQDAGFFQQPVRPGPGTASLNPSYLARQSAQHLFPGATGIQNRFMPQIQSIVAPAAQNLARAFGVNTREFNVAMRVVNDRLKDFRDNIYRGRGYVPSSRYLTLEGADAARSDRRGRFGRGARVLAGAGLNYAADRSHLLLAGGALTSYIGGNNTAASVTGGTLSGAGIGGMLAGVPGLIVGGVVGAGKALIDALGPDRIRKANEKLGKELEEMGKKFSEFSKIGIGDAEFKIAVADLSSEIQRRMSDIAVVRGRYNEPVNPTIGTNGVLQDESKETWQQLGYLVNNPIQSIRESYLKIFASEERISRFYKERISEGNIDVKNNAEEILRTGGFEELSLQASGYFKQLTDKYGKLVDENGLTAKGRELDVTFGITNLVKAMTFGGTNKQNVAFNQRLLDKGRPLSAEELDIAQFSQGLMIANLLTKKVKEMSVAMDKLVFEFDAFKITIQELGAIVDESSKRVQNMSEMTDKYFTRALSGPTTNEAIINKKNNPFENPTAYSPKQLAEALDYIGVGRRSELGGTVIGSRSIQQVIPQIIEKASKLNLGQADLKNDLRDLLLNEFSGYFRELPEQLKTRIDGFINEQFDKEGQGTTFDKLLSSGSFNSIIDKIVGDVGKEGFDAAAKIMEQRNALVQRLVEITKQELELEQKRRDSLVDLVNQSQEYSGRRANLFYGEDPQAQQNRFRSNRSQIIDTIMGGNKFQDFNLLLNERDNAEQSGDVDKFREYQGLINRQIEATKILADRNEELANIEKQVLDQQKKREQGRNIIEWLVNANPADKAKLIQGVGAAATGQGLNNQFVAKNALDALKTLQGFDIGGNYAKNLEGALAAPTFGNLGQLLGGKGFDFIDIAGTAKGQSPEEQRLDKEFGSIAQKSKEFGDILQQINDRASNFAKSFSIKEIMDTQKEIQDVRIKANKVSIDWTGKEFVETAGEEFVEEFASGGRLGGTGPIPILAHGGELIIPKKNVDRGMGGVVEFAKTQGMSFANGGIVDRRKWAENLRNKEKQRRLSRREYSRGITTLKLPDFAGIQAQEEDFWGDYLDSDQVKKRQQEKPVFDRFSSPLWKNAKRGYVSPSKQSQMTSYKAGQITPEMQELKARNLAKRQGPGFLTYRPDYYNIRYGEGYARGFDPKKLQQTRQVVEAERLRKEHIIEVRKQAEKATTGGIPYDKIQEMKKKAIENIVFGTGTSKPITSLIDESLQKIAKEFGVSADFNPSRIMTDEEKKSIEKKFGIQGVQSAYYRNEKRIAVPKGVNPSYNVLKHEFSHGIYRQRGLENDPYIQEIIGEAKDFLDKKWKDPKEFEQKFGPKNYALSPSELFSNIMMTGDNSAGKQYKERILEYLKKQRQVPKFASGTPMVTQTGMAQVHRGEMITPAKANPNNSNSTSMNQFESLDKAITKLGGILQELKIPERIVLEFGTIQHQINFNGNDVLAQQVAKQVAEMTGQIIQKQLKSVISPLSGETLVG